MVPLMGTPSTSTVNRNSSAAGIRNWSAFSRWYWARTAPAWSRYVISSASEEYPSETQTESRISNISSSGGGTGTGRLCQWYSVWCRESPNDRAGDCFVGTRSSYWKRNFAGHVSYVLMEEYDKRDGTRVASAIARV